MPLDAFVDTGNNLSLWSEENLWVGYIRLNKHGSKSL